MTERFDVVVVGGGPVGENAASYAAQGGLRVALVEAELLGGECSYWACMPSKALLRTPQAVAAARRLRGVSADFDVAGVLDRRDSFTSHWSDTGQQEWAENAGLTVVRGRGRLGGARTVQVGDRTLVAAHAVVLCTGSVPVRPDVPGLADVRVWGSREATSTKRVPGRLGVLGGGVVGSELAQAFARLGSAVTMVVAGDRLLGSTEPFAGERVAQALRADGVDLRLATPLDGVAPAGQDVALRVGGGETVVVDELLVATGRRPALDDLGLETVGLTGGLEVGDDGLVVGVDGGWLYAAGDVTGRAPLTHQGKYAARIVGTTVAARAAGATAEPVPWGEHAASADHAAVPQVVFTDPGVGAVGRTAEQARTGGLDVRVVDVDLAVAGSALHADGYSGVARFVVDEARSVLVGVTFVGQDVAELLHAATVAVVGEVPLDRLWHAVPAFPTISEVWLRALEAYRAG